MKHAIYNHRQFKEYETFGFQKTGHDHIYPIYYLRVWLHALVQLFVFFWLCGYFSFALFVCLLCVCGGGGGGGGFRGGRSEFEMNVLKTCSYII